MTEKEIVKKPFHEVIINKMKSQVGHLASLKMNVFVLQDSEYVFRFLNDILIKTEFIPEHLAWILEELTRIHTEMIDKEFEEHMPKNLQAVIDHLKQWSNKR